MSISKKERIYYIYLLTRDDGMQYIGTTDTLRERNRMYVHQYYNKRFIGRTFTITILLCWKERGVHDYEEYFIKKYDTFYNGLNRSINGKGNHLSPNFTTSGYKHSLETKLLIGLKSSVAHKASGWRHKEETKIEQCNRYKGQALTYKISQELIDKVLDFYTSKPNLRGVGKIRANGRKLTYERAFANRFCKKFKLSNNGLYKIITTGGRRCPLYQTQNQ